ncbi:hypothetical protein EDC01DRAFT_636946 [Geopyxis carbonaria]|nr:hypothetical protein EDC01DRAFT_636946 [Geopyxis carbonaria]
MSLTCARQNLVKLGDSARSGSLALGFHLFANPHSTNIEITLQPDLSSSRKMEFQGFSEGKVLADGDDLSLNPMREGFASTEILEANQMKKGEESSSLEVGVNQEDTAQELAERAKTPRGKPRGRPRGSGRGRGRPRKNTVLENISEENYDAMDTTSDLGPSQNVDPAKKDPQFATPNKKMTPQNGTGSGLRRSGRLQSASSQKASTGSEILRPASSGVKKSSAKKSAAERNKRVSISGDPTMSTRSATKKNGNDDNETPEKATEAESNSENNSANSGAAYKPPKRAPRGVKKRDSGRGHPRTAGKVPGRTPAARSATPISDPPTNDVPTEPKVLYIPPEQEFLSSDEKTSDEVSEFKVKVWPKRPYKKRDNGAKVGNTDRPRRSNGKFGKSNSGLGTKKNPGKGEEPFTPAKENGSGHACDAAVSSDSSIPREIITPPDATKMPINTISPSKLNTDGLIDHSESPSIRCTVSTVATEHRAVFEGLISRPVSEIAVFTMEATMEHSLDIKDLIADAERRKMMRHDWV